MCVCVGHAALAAPWLLPLRRALFINRKFAPNVDAIRTHSPHQPPPPSRFHSLAVPAAAAALWQPQSKHNSEIPTVLLPVKPPHAAPAPAPPPASPSPPPMTTTKTKSEEEAEAAAAKKKTRKTNRYFCCLPFSPFLLHNNFQLLLLRGKSLGFCPRFGFHNIPPNCHTTLPPTPAPTLQGQRRCAACVAVRRRLRILCVAM